MTAPTDTALLVFAKAPVAGLAKTRLAPALGLDGAARLAERLLRHCVQQAAACGFAHTGICAAPDAAHPVFAELAETHGVHLSVQGEGDLGTRMHRAFLRTLQRHARVLLIGADAIALHTERLIEAARALEQHDAVFVPAHDGGYALVGLRQPAAGLFVDMPWSTAQVMAITRERAAASGLSLAELEPVADIDEPADLVHVPRGWL
jgi:hypothetical protein